ncbi:MAG: CBS domain-containing protein [Methanothrix sp.]|jgi:Zn-dependent protease/CBS domain-containing protein|nr:CBS domain-containing protein [Methanothrix sp.]
MNFSLGLGKIMGIPVWLHWSFLVVVLYVAWAFATFSAPIFGRTYGFAGVEPEGIKWVFSLGFALLLFVCVGLHELGHSYVARKSGIAIKSITLYFFGGVAAMEEIPRNPGLELKMAFAGPAVSGVIGLVCVVLANIASVPDDRNPFAIMLWTLGVMNLILMAFNLLPAFPMDGGRLLRAWFATRMPYITATRTAASVGKMFAILMLVVGLFSFNFLLLFVAFFVYMGASEEEKATAINISLEGILVKDIMSHQVQTVKPDMTLQELKELMFQQKHRGYPVMNGEKLEGIVTIADLQNVPDEERSKTRVEQVMTRKLYVIAPKEEAAMAMKMMNEIGIRRLPVIDEGKLAGIVSREDLVRAIELSTGRGF